MSIHLARADELLRQQRAEPAISELQQHLVINPDDPIAHSFMARAEAMRSNRKEALHWANQAIHLGPDVSYCHYIRSWVLDYFDKHQEAEAAVLEAIRLDPYSPDFFSLLGQIRMHRANWKGALEAADAGLRIDAGHIGSVNVRAMSLMRLGQKDHADSAIQGALAQDPEDARSHTNQGWICLNSGRREEAIEHFREALRLDPSIESARLGVLEALRTKYRLYRVLYSFHDWMSGFSAAVRQGIIIGLWLLSRVISGVGNANPSLQPVAFVLIAIYGFFVFLTWTGRATFDIFVRFHPLGRLALSRSQLCASNWVAAALGSALVSLGFILTTPSAAPLFAAICFAFFGLPASQVGRYRHHLLLANSILAVLYATILGLDIAGILIRTDPTWLINAFTGLLWLFVGSTWVLGFTRASTNASRRR